MVTPDEWSWVVMDLNWFGVYVLLMSASILKYGQIIRIRADEFANCFLTSKSYTDQNVYFQIYNKEDTFLSGGQDIINISNYREALFEVLPTSSFEINDEMNSQRDEAKKAESAPRAKTEADQFTAMIAEKRGKYISFGAKVIFRHVDSGYYLYGSWDCASAGIGAFKIEGTAMSATGNSPQDPEPAEDNGSDPEDNVAA